MNKQEHEILSITQEECAEVIQAISKVFRFGIDTEWKGETNREHLEEEMGDVLAMISVAQQCGIVDRSKVCEAWGNKLKKLAKWSNIDVAALNNPYDGIKVKVVKLDNWHWALMEINPVRQFQVFDTEARARSAIDAFGLVLVE